MRHFLIVNLVLALTGVVLLSGCASTNGMAQRSAFVDTHPGLSEIHAEAILNGQIMVGMTDEMVQAAWGKPGKVEKVELEKEPALHWIYGNYFYGGNITDLYFDPEGTLIRYEVNYNPAHANSGTVSTSGDGSSTGTILGQGGGISLTKDSGGRP